MKVIKQMLFQDTRIQHVCYWLSNVTTYYFISLLYDVFKEDYVIFQCYPELRMQRAILCTYSIYISKKY